MTHITRLIFNSMSLCRKTFIVIFWDGSINVIFCTPWTRTGNTDSASSWTKRLNMRFTSRQRLPCQQLIARSVHKAKLKCLNLYWELRTLSYFSFYITTKQAPTADFCFHIYIYIPYFFRYTFCSNKRAQLGKCFHTSHIFFGRCFEYLIVLFMI